MKFMKYMVIPMQSSISPIVDGVMPFVFIINKGVSQVFIFN